MRHATWFVCLLLGGTLGFAAPANALTTTYTFVGSMDYLCTDAEFTAEFPELCPGGAPSELSVTFRHDQPIWDNEASGCDPDYNPEGCSASYFTEIVEVVLSGVATFRGTEILGFFHADFLGPCPVSDCGGPLPYILLGVRDNETGLEVVVDENQAFSLLEYSFPDGRWFEDSGDWERGPTVPEPGTLALFGLGLAGLGLTRRRTAS